MTGRERLIVALDVPSLGEAVRLIERVGEAAGFYKVGLELHAAEGPRAAAAVRRYGRLFLDVKLHDIPETVGRAVSALAATGAEMLTVHADGGRAMLTRAAQVAHGHGMKVLAVTALTSLDAGDLAEIGAAGTPAQLVARRAQLAVAAGCDGVVAAPTEVAALRQLLPPPLLIVTPGVRPAGAPSSDQKRVGTPAQAVRDGADYVVVGRPIREAEDPAAAARAIAAEIDEA